MRQGRIILKYILLVLTVILFVPIVMVAAGTEIPFWMLPYLSVTSGMFVAFAFWFLTELGGGRGSPEDKQAHMLHEIAALNHHAMVSLTDSDARLFHVNDKLLEATGYKESELIGRTTDILYDEADEELFKSIREGLDKGHPWTGETRVRCKNGDVIWTQATILPRLDPRRRLIGTISIRTDITEAKSAAEQKDLYTTVHKLWDEVYMIDPETLRFLYMNEAAMERVGWSEEVYQDRFIMDDDSEFDEAGFRARIDPLLSGKVDVITYSDEFKGVPYEVRIQAVTAFNGKQKLVALLRDISEQTALEHAKAELLATISHELRTPMTSIKGAMGLLLSSAAGELPEKARDMLSIAYRNSDRLVMIINDILDIEKMAAGHMIFDMQEAPLGMVIDEAIAANEQFANRFDVTVEKVDFDESLTASYDFGRTLQVMTNLLSNAAKYSPPGGKIDVSLARDGDIIRVGVRDFGVGIPDNEQALIFERFAQASGTNNRRGVAGTGLGLNIARLIMQEQNGSIGVISKVGEGSEFYVEFPVSEVTTTDGRKRVDSAV